ncbi:MAG TPA: hypothetical protein VLC74_13075 [Rhizomicrobium sp.]|nr:hypothetical protein [Rhizomicrobium sp.]
MEQHAYDIRLLLVFGFLLPWPALATAGPCYDLSKGQPTGLTGTLDYAVFAGPPHYANVQKGDAPNPSFVLRLAHPVCIQGHKSVDPKNSVQAVQLVKTAKVEGKLKPLLHRQVTVAVKNPAPDPAHRQAPVFAWVTSIAPTPHRAEVAKGRAPAPTTHQMNAAKAGGTAAAVPQIKFPKERRMAGATHVMELAKKRVPPPTTQEIDVAKEDGTAATTVRTFYAGLADGRGDLASAMVIPRKRAQGPFSADELSHFFGHLKKPIRLENVETNGSGEVLVQYRYAASARECNGRALVKTVMLSGKTYIQSIHALDGC